MDAKRPIIEKHDIPAGTTLTTRHGMKLAYGTLWMTWTDREEKEGVAASMAREILRAELSREECGEGISLVRSTETGNLRSAVIELYNAAKKRDMHDNSMTTETAEAVSACYDYLEGFV